MYLKVYFCLPHTSEGAVLASVIPVDTSNKQSRKSTVSLWGDSGGIASLKLLTGALKFPSHNCNMWWRAATMRGQQQQQQLSLTALHVEVWQRDVSCEGHSYWLSTSAGLCRIRESWRRTTAGTCCDITSCNRHPITTFNLTSYPYVGIKVFV